MPPNRGKTPRISRAWKLRTLIWGGLAGALFSSWVLLTQPLLWAGPRLSGPEASPERLRETVRLVSEEFTPRNSDHPENLDRAAAFIGGELRKSGAQVGEQTYPFKRNTYRNVIGSFGPATEEKVLVGAHYDAHGAFPAADDNASGVAGLLELARLLSQSPPEGRVELVAFTLEEDCFDTPNMGSAVLARHMASGGQKLRAMISLEMIGYFNDRPGSQAYPLPLLSLLYPARGNYIAVVGRPQEALLARRVKQAMLRGMEPPVRSINAPASVPGLDLSDHLPFWREGFPALMVTDTAFLRNANYHAETDTWDTLDYDRMAEVVRGVHRAVLDLTER